MRKLSLAVCFGVLLAAAVIWGVYYFAVGISARHQRQAAAVEEMQSMTADVQAVNDRMYQEIRDKHPGSPCNRLTGQPLLDCLSLKSSSEREKFALKYAAHSATPAR